MKKIIVMAAIAILAVGSVFAQNKFRGIVTYSVTSTGETAVQIPADYTAEVKVFDNKVLTSSQIFTQSPMINSVLIDGLKQYSCMDLSMIMMYLEQNDVELSYKGSSKIVVSHEFTQNDVDSLTIPVTEGFYIEYDNSATKTIAGMTAKKAIIHVFNDEGEDKPITIWYSDEMGPDVNFLFNGIRGVALEYSIDMGEGQQITLSATDIKKGKVKEVDMLLPSGYETISQEESSKLFEEIGEEMKYLQEEE